MRNLMTALSGAALSELHYNSGLNVTDFIEWLKVNYTVFQSDHSVSSLGLYYSVHILTEEGNLLQCYTYSNQYLPIGCEEEPNNLSVKWNVKL